MVMISHSATELVMQQEKRSNHPKENEIENVLKISLMRGNETKLSKEKAYGKEPWSLAWGTTFCVKSLDLLGVGGENPALSSLQNLLKAPRECGRHLASNKCIRNSWCPVGLLPCCCLLQNLRIKTKKTNSQLCLQKVSWGRVVNSYILKGSLEIIRNSVSLDWQ